jgi:hypothetical protein
MQAMAFNSQAAWASFFTVRRPGSVATRRSAADRLMRISSTQSISSARPSLRGNGAVGACARSRLRNGTVDGSGIKALLDIRNATRGGGIEDTVKQDSLDGRTRLPAQTYGVHPLDA